MFLLMRKPHMDMEVCLKLHQRAADGDGNLDEGGVGFLLLLLHGKKHTELSLLTTVCFCRHVGPHTTPVQSSPFLILMMALLSPSPCLIPPLSL